MTAPRPRRSSARPDGAERRAGRATEPLRVLTVGLDPHAQDEVRRALPDAQISAREAGDPAATTGAADVVLVDLARETPPERERGGPVVIGLLPLAHDGRSHADLMGVDAVLKRPLLSDEVAETVSALVGRRPDVRHVGRWIGRADWWTARLRVAAVLLAAVVEVLLPGEPIVEISVLAAALVYAVVRFPIRSRPRVVAVDAVVVAAILVLTGGAASGYLPLALLTAVVAGIHLRLVPALAAGGVLALGGYPGLVVGTAVLIDRVVAWTFFLPLVAAVAALASDLAVHRRHERESLADTNRLLRDLHDLARSAPSRLDVRNVAEEATSAAQRLGHPAALLVVDQGGEARLTAGYGLAEASYRPFSFEDVVAHAGGDAVALVPHGNLRPPLSRILAGQPAWAFVPIRRGTTTTGMLVVAAPEGRLAAATRRDLEAIVDEAALGLDNARVFGLVREVALDVERWRLANDLHDGVAQGLAHVRFELDLLRRQRQLSAEELREELERLKRVTDRALRDIREMVDGLRATAAGAGISAALREHVRDFGGLTSPRVRFTAHRDPRLDREVERHVYRIVQEALSNALRHADAETISVVLDAEDGEMVLRVDDDGVGIGAAATAGGGEGIGLRSMEERAQRIGGTLRVADRPEGGTRLELRLPLGGRQAEEVRP